MKKKIKKNKGNAVVKQPILSPEQIKLRDQATELERIENEKALNKIEVDIIKSLRDLPKVKQLEKEKTELLKKLGRI